MRQFAKFAEKAVSATVGLTAGLVAFLLFVWVGMNHPDVAGDMLGLGVVGALLMTAGYALMKRKTVIRLAFGSLLMTLGVMFAVAVPMQYMARPMIEAILSL